MVSCIILHVWLAYIRKIFILLASQNHLLTNFRAHFSELQYGNFEYCSFYGDKTQTRDSYSRNYRPHPAYAGPATSQACQAINAQTCSSLWNLFYDEKAICVNSWRSDGLSDINGVGWSMSVPYKSEERSVATEWAGLQEVYSSIDFLRGIIDKYTSVMSRALQPQHDHCSLLLQLLQSVELSDGKIAYNLF